MGVKSAVEMLPQLILRLLIVLLIIGLIIYAIIKTVKFLRENSFRGKGKMIIISVISILIMASSWVINMGWLRLILTFLLIPVIHILAFFLMNLYSSKYFEKSKKLKVLNVFFVMTFLACHLFMADFDDVSIYAFYRLIRDERLLSITGQVSFTSFFAHIVLFIVQVIEIRKLKKSI